jgi:DNA-directed RNA polymerase beta' subunit
MKSSKEILELEKTLGKLENLHASFDYLRITIASPTRIKKWSERTLPSGEIIGEVLKPETINFRTHQPEVSGLFCEKIFGPIKNWKCKCGKYNGFVLDKICEECHVEIIEARVRRYRMGHIDLTCPVTHFWYLKGVPNYLCILLKCIDEDISLVDIEQIVYFKEGERIIDPQNPLFPFFRSARTETELNELQKLIKQKDGKSTSAIEQEPDVIRALIKTKTVELAAENKKLEDAIAALNKDYLVDFEAKFKGQSGGSRMLKRTRKRKNRSKKTSRYYFKKNKIIKKSGRGGKRKKYTLRRLR